jgi:hypothetical protein
VGLFVGRDGLFRDAAVGAGLEAARRAQFLTSSVLACHCEPVISARGSCGRASRMASAMSSAARRVRFTASSANTA